MKRMMMFCSFLLLFSVMVIAQDNQGTQNRDMNKGDMSDQKEETTEFVKKAASGGMMEVRLGNLAQERASTQAVKDFGEMMVKDHSKANDELKATAQKNNISVPADMIEDHMEKVNELSELSGNEFDEKYIDMMVEDHQEDIEEFREAAQDEELNPDVRNFAQKTLPTLEQHLQKAQEIQKSMDTMTRGNNDNDENR